MNLEHPTERPDGLSTKSPKTTQWEDILKL